MKVCGGFAVVVLVVAALVPQRSEARYVYRLDLGGGKYYVGATRNPKKRFDDHFNGRGSSVTKKYRPVAVDFVEKCGSWDNCKNAERELYQNTKTQYGPDKVRGAGNTNSKNF